MNRSFYLLLHSCGALLDELLGDAGAAASGTDGEGFGLGQQLVVGHLDAVLFGQLGEDDLEPGFLTRLYAPANDADSSCRVSASWMSSPVRSERVSLMRWRRLEVA